MLDVHVGLSVELPATLLRQDAIRRRGCVHARAHRRLGEPHRGPRRRAASSYDQTCADDKDCTGISEGSACNACNFSCTNAAINARALPQYNSDTATIFPAAYELCPSSCGSGTHSNLTWLPVPTPWQLRCGAIARTLPPGARTAVQGVHGAAGEEGSHQRVRLGLARGGERVLQRATACGSDGTLRRAPECRVRGGGGVRGELRSRCDVVRKAHDPTHPGRMRYPAPCAATRQALH